MGLFGGNSSSSTTNVYDTLNQASTARDNSVVTSQNISATDGSTISVTDNGAVKQALDYATNVTAKSETMFEGALATVRDQNKLLANAYQQGGAGDQTQLKYAGFILVGLAVTAVSFFALKAK